MTLLSLVGWLHVALAVAIAAAMPFDERSVLGVDPWVKPFKFAVSIAIYLLTLAWLVGYARPAAPRAAAGISRGASLAGLRASLAERTRTAAVTAFAALYLAAFAGLLLQALAGRPLLS